MPITVPGMQPPRMDPIIISALEGNPGSPLILNLVNKNYGHKLPAGKTTYVGQAMGRIKYAYKKAKQVTSKQQERQKGLYD